MYAEIRVQVMDKDPTDCDHVLGRLELPKGDINRDTTLTLSL